MSHGFHTIDYAGLSEADRDTASLLLGGSAAEFADGDPESPHQVLEEIGVDLKSAGGLVIAVVRWGDRQAPEILRAMDEHTAAVPERGILPYAVTMVIGQYIVEFNEMQGMTATKILETEERQLEMREQEALDELAGQEFDSTLEREVAYRYMPMRALTLPWDEETAADLMFLRNFGLRTIASEAIADPTERRICLGIIGKRVFNEGIGMNLDNQPQSDE